MDEFACVREILSRDEVFKFYEGIFDVAIHRTHKLDIFTFVVVPIQGDANVLLWVHDKFDGIQCLIEEIK